MYMVCYTQPPDFKAAKLELDRVTKMIRRHGKQDHSDDDLYYECPISNEANVYRISGTALIIDKHCNLAVCTHTGYILARYDVWPHAQVCPMCASYQNSSKQARDMVGALETSFDFTKIDVPDGQLGNDDDLLLQRAKFHAIEGLALRRRALCQQCLQDGKIKQGMFGKKPCKLHDQRINVLCNEYVVLGDSRSKAYRRYFPIDVEAWKEEHNGEAPHESRPNIHPVSPAPHAAADEDGEEEQTERRQVQPVVTPQEPQEVPLERSDSNGRAGASSMPEARVEGTDRSRQGQGEKSRSGMARALSFFGLTSAGGEQQEEEEEEEGEGEGGSARHERPQTEEPETSQISTPGQAVSHRRRGRIPVTGSSYVPSNIAGPKTLQFLVDVYGPEESGIISLAQPESEPKLQLVAVNSPGPQNSQAGHTDQHDQQSPELVNSPSPEAHEAEAEAVTEVANSDHEELHALPLDEDDPESPDRQSSFIGSIKTLFTRSPFKNPKKRKSPSLSPSPSKSLAMQTASNPDRPSEVSQHRDPSRESPSKFAKTSIDFSADGQAAKELYLLQDTPDYVEELGLDSLISLESLQPDVLSLFSNVKKDELYNLIQKYFWYCVQLRKDLDDDVVRSICRQRSSSASSTNQDDQLSLDEELELLAETFAKLTVFFVRAFRLMQTEEANGIPFGFSAEQTDALAELSEAKKPTMNHIHALWLSAIGEQRDSTDPDTSRNTAFYMSAMLSLIDSENQQWAPYTDCAELMVECLRIMRYVLIYQMKHRDTSSLDYEELWHLAIDADRPNVGSTFSETFYLTQL